MTINRVSTAAAAVVAGLVGAVSANAADLSYPPVRASTLAAVASAPAWSGFYLGAGAGAIFGNAGGNSTYIDPYSGSVTTIGSPNLASSAATVNVYGGYNFQVSPQVVLGLEVEANWLNSGFSGGYGWGGGGDIMTADWQFGIAARAGYLLAPSSMIYLKAGWAATQMNINAANYFGGALPSGVLVNVNDGYRNSAIIGGGIETLVAPNWLARIEAEYTIGAENSTISVPAYGVSEKINADYLSARLGLAYRF